MSESWVGVGEDGGATAERRPLSSALSIARLSCNRKRTLLNRSVSAVAPPIPERSWNGDCRSDGGATADRLPVSSVSDELQKGVVIPLITKEPRDCILLFRLPENTAESKRLSSGTSDPPRGVGAAIAVRMAVPLLTG